MFWIICVYNDKTILEDYLLKSLEGQSAPYELTLIDNTDGRYRSAPEVFNAAGWEAGGKYLLFVHQDVAMEGADWLEETERFLDGQENIGIAGPAGVTQAGVFSNVRHGLHRDFAGEFRLTEATSVQTLDGCVLIIPKGVFDGLPFDATTIKGWCLYGTDYALTAARLGYRVLAIPQKIYHLSTGRWNADYYRAIRTIIHKHRQVASRIHTTMDYWSTNPWRFYGEITVRRIKRHCMKHR